MGILNTFHIYDLRSPIKLISKNIFSPVTRGKIFSQNCQIVIPYLSVLLQHRKNDKIYTLLGIKRTFSYPWTLQIQKVFRDFLFLCYYILFITTFHELRFKHGNHPVLVVSVYLEMLTSDSVLMKSRRKETQRVL